MSLTTVTTKAQSPDKQWSAPYRLSHREASVSFDTNTIISDLYGNVHVFWVETTENFSGPAIEYSRFDGENWTEPVDIQVAQNSPAIGAVAAVVDERLGILHLIWAEGADGPVYYSQAPVDNALSARYWSHPVQIDIPAYKVKLQVDSNNILHLIYTNAYADLPGVYYLRSEDQGRTWSSPVGLDPAIPRDQVPWDIFFELSEEDNLHILWEYRETENFEPRSVHYIHSLDGGETWGLPVTIDEADEEDDELRAAGPVLAVHDQSVYVIWAGHSSTQREYRFSTDAGQTWSVPIDIFGHLHGQAGDWATTDAEGRVHYFGQIRWPQGLYHAYTEQERWTTPSLAYLIKNSDADPIGDHIHVHTIRASVRVGNQLVVIFTNAPDEPQLQLYAMFSTLDDISSLATLPMPTPKPTATPRSNVSLRAEQGTVTPTPTRPKFTGDAPPVVDSPSPGYPLWLGLTPVALLLGGAVTFQLMRKK